jgi:hypothetical protein
MGCVFLIGWLDLLTPHSHNSGLQVIQRSRWSTLILQFTWTLHSLIHFLPLFCSCQFRTLDSVDVSAGWSPDTHLFTLDYSTSSLLKVRVSQSVSHGAHDQIFITLWQLRSCFCGPPSLTRGRVCLFHMLLALASAVFLGSESSLVPSLVRHNLRHLSAQNPEAIFTDVSLKAISNNSNIWRIRLNYSLYEDWRKTMKGPKVLKMVTIRLPSSWIRQN